MGSQARSRRGLGCATSSTSSTTLQSPTPCARSMASCTWRPGSARSSSPRIRTPGTRTIGYARTLRGSSSTPRSRPGRRVYVQPTVAFVYPPDGPVSEDTPVPEVPPILRSALAAEHQTERFARAGGRGVVLRLGLLDGPGTGDYGPLADFGATLHVSDAGARVLSALSLPSGIYNVCRNGERVSAERFTRAVGWHPQRSGLTQRAPADRLGPSLTAGVRQPLSG